MSRVAGNVFLIGYRGSGKTTVAAHLSKRLGWPWLDADEELERRSGCTIKEIFAAGGESAFRELETAIVAELARLNEHVLSLGGGAVLRHDNRQAIRSAGKTVWLRAQPETLLARITGDPTTAERRPDLTVGGGLGEIHQLLARRAPIYQQAADYIVDCDDRTAEQVASDIAIWLKQERGIRG